MQWSADLTEHAHIAVVKVPARAGNNYNYDVQEDRAIDMDDESNNEDIDSKTV
ncbi:hypothetical protein DEU56DRAFT_913035 [Suillus clintonianus]|uniref:uncharacterized protein n=1 Tax=Suillus clintonianus TaxID=1904413 RepID=UPI001B876DE7|nr:uncharacterized protein DEU56DRAFT_913035 [Suillus clintonianus]KAG2136459.1 hypothetical protein DEU56DRAFT_913035 [Suillus clintonianus]